MSRPAVAALEDARERVAALLWPPAVGRWLRLVLLVTFVGGGGSASSAGGNLQIPTSGGLRVSARRYAGRGLRLFAFRVVVVAVTLLLGGGPVALVAWSVLRADPAAEVLVVPALLVAAVVALCAWLVLTLTTDLVVPAMLAADVRGPLAGWRRVAGVVAANPVDSGLYLLLRVVLGVAAGIVVGLVGSLVALVAGVPFAVAGAAALVAAGSALSPREGAVLVALGLAFALVAAGLFQVVRTPVVCYLRAFAVATLGRLSPELALFAETDGHESAGGE